MRMQKTKTKTQETSTIGRTFIIIPGQAAAAAAQQLSESVSQFGSQSGSSSICYSVYMSVLIWFAYCAAWKMLSQNV